MPTNFPNFPNLGQGQQGQGAGNWRNLLQGLGGQMRARPPQMQAPPPQQGQPPAPGSFSAGENPWLAYTQGSEQFARSAPEGWNNLLKHTSYPALQNLNVGTGGAAPMAYQQLFKLLGQEGRTDPGAMNWQLSDISRASQNAQDQFAAQAAGGLGQHSGVAQAGQAAIGQAGLDRRARVMSDEAQKAEQRKRADMMLFMEMAMRPSLDLIGTERQADAAEGQGTNAWGEISKLLGAGMQGASTYFGGPKFA